jgi:molybdate transport system regulatory protein
MKQNEQALYVITRLKICKTRPFFSVGPMELFDKIETYSSIKKATGAMGMSYTKALRIIRTIEAELGFPVVISEKGGNNRGMTKLTKKGKEVLETFREIYTDVSAYAEKLTAKKFKF